MNPKLTPLQPDVFDAVVNALGEALVGRSRHGRFMHLSVQTGIGNGNPSYRDLWLNWSPSTVNCGCCLLPAGSVRRQTNGDQ